MSHAPDGSVLDVGRRTRTLSPALRRALVERDRGCRFPGCGLARCDAHHVKHWADGGETSLENTLLVCRFHHRLLHEEGFQLHRLPGGEIEFRTPHGRRLPHAPEPPRQPIDPFAALLEQLEDGGIVVDPYTGTPTWDGSPTDLGIAVEWFLAKTGAEPQDSVSSAPQVVDEIVSTRPAEDDDGGEDVPSAPIAEPRVKEEAAAATSWRRADHWEEDDTDGEVDDEAEIEISARRLEELEGLLAEKRKRAAVLAYEFVSSTGERLPFEVALFHPEFHREWNDD